MIPCQPRKGTYFVHAPFVRCPSCGQDQFGVLMICDRHYMRRCKHCTHDQHFPLPPLEKKVIYLDQFVISNMMKELDPTSPEISKGTNGGFYRKLFEQLDRLYKLQLIICPDSPIQHDESAVDPRFEKLRLVFRHFSHGLSFEPPETIFHSQLLHAFNRWLGRPPEEPLGRESALSRKYNVWNERIRLDLNYTVTGLTASLRQSGENRTKHIRAICEHWRDAESFSFKNMLEGESRAIVNVPWRQWREYAARLAAAQVAPVRNESTLADLASLFPMAASGLVAQMFDELKDLPPEQRFEKVSDFFDSEEARSVGYVHITALFWASLARDIRAGRNPQNYPTGSLYNDVDVVASYAPFCDAMFVDRQISHLASQAELKRALAPHCRLYSFRKGEDEQFLEYLAGIEKNASPEHLAKVTEVYGADWPTPYVDMLANID
jgi:hypothetical protein